VSLKGGGTIYLSTNHIFEMIQVDSCTNGNHDDWVSCVINVQETNDAFVTILQCEVDLQQGGGGSGG